MAGSEASRRSTSMPPSFGSIEESLLAALSSRDQGTRQHAIAEVAKVADPVELIEMVGDHEDAQRRNAAIEALTRAGARGVATVVRALQHEDPEVAMFAAGILGRSRDPSVVPHLVELLGAGDVNLQQQAVESLANLRSPAALDALLGLLGGDVWVAFSAIHALGAIGDPRAAEAIARLLPRDEYREVATEALGQIGGPVAVRELARRLRDEDEGGHFAATLLALAAALESLPGLDALEGAPEWAALGAPDALALHERLHGILAGDDDDGTASGDARLVGAAADLVCAARVEALYPAVVAAGRDPLLADRLQMCVRTVGAPIAKAVADGLRSRSTSVRLLACRGAGVLGLRESAPAVAELVRDGDEQVRAAAVQTLARLRDDWSAPAVVELLADPTEIVREAAILALARMDASAVTAALVTRRSMDPPQMRAALDVMRRAPHVSQRPFVEQALADDDDEVRRSAIAALVAQRPVDLVELLEPLCADAEVGVRRDAVAAIGLSRDPRARDVLLAHIARDPPSRAHAVRALGDVGDASVAPQLVELFEREPLVVRLAVVDALAAMTEAGAEPHFVRWLADPEPEVRRAAVEALGRSPTPTARRRVAVAVRDPAWQVRAAAVEILAVPPAEAWNLAALERLCHDASEYVADLAQRRLEHVTATKVTVPAPPQQ